MPTANQTPPCEKPVPPMPRCCLGMVALHCVQSGRTVLSHFTLHGLACALSTRRFDRIPIQTELLRPCGTCCEASVGSPSWPGFGVPPPSECAGTRLSGREGDPTLASQHVPQGRKSAVCTGILPKRRVESAQASPWSVKWNVTVLPDCTQCRAAIPKQPQDGGGTCVSQRSDRHEVPPLLPARK